MKNHWIIQCVGTSEEDQAHLRLLLRSARKHVAEDWVWGDESEADLLLMDGHGPIGDVAIRRASQPGVASAQLIEADESAPAGLFLRKPFHSEALAAMLNEAARGETAGAAPSPDPASPTVAEAVAGGDPAGNAIDTIAPVDAQAEATGHVPQSPPQAQGASHPSSSKTTGPAIGEDALNSLLHYLPKRVLGGPARIVLPGVPPLVIDPDTRMFWADGILPTLEPYARHPLRFGDWQRLDDEELEEARKHMAARPFAQLIWMDTFIHSKGVLSRRFDPEGTYGLSKRLDLSNDYPRALRISALMSQPRRLDAIARASGAEIGEVFDVVNAYEAIGFLEWSRRGSAPPRKT
jgi:hypothetical protein